MKRILACLFFLGFIITETKANVGDTTWVTIYNLRRITQYGNYDTTAVLPTGKTFRKIRLHYILGRYACPSGTQYCGSWDYTTQVYVKPPGADTVEIARVITPYATDWLSSNRKHDFIVDVTEYSSVLQGNLDVRYKYDGYSWGFTLTLKLEMIEGVPPMEATSVKNIYDGYFAYGKTSDPIENHLPAKSYQYVSPNVKAFVKNTISGHGSDDNQCGEFCSKYYNLKIDGSQVSQKQLWKSDCGYNDISPQTGTWLYDRANWCPGQVVYPIRHDVSSLTTPSTNFSVDLDMQPYVSPTQSNTGGYNIVSQLITYSAPNFSTDVSIEDIIAPTSDPNYARSNNTCSHPKIKVKNTGTNNVTQIVFSFGVVGGASGTYTWNGNLAFLEEAIIDLGTINLYTANTTNQFTVNVDQVNGTPGDENSYNNTYSSTYSNVKVYPSKIIIYNSSNAAESSINPGYNESHWEIRDEAGNIVASKPNNPLSTLTRDTIDLPNGCYTFTMDDDGCDGFSWWVYQYYNPNPGNGVLRFYKIGSSVPIKVFNGDFGCRITERFMVNTIVTSVSREEVKNNFQLFPNPSSDVINLMFDMNEYQDLNFVVTDLTGKEVLAGNIINAGYDTYSVNTSELSNGTYLIRCNFKNGEVITRKFVISN